MSIGVNLRVTGYCRQGGRKYMEDFFSVAYQQTEDERDLEYAFIGIYDGHGGAEAAAFAKEHLMESIIKHKSFWSDNDEEVLRAIKDGYIATHYAMWKEQEKWPRTASGLPSTAGTTASVAFIRRGKIYVGHVGDSGIVLGYQLPNSAEWKAKPLTRDHKPENADEMSRIQQCGGKVVLKSGVPRVVWNRPRIGHQGPVRRSTPIDEIPFLAVARSLGDLWSYNSRINQFIVSPNPDCSVITIDTSIHRCLIFGTDGLYNMLSPQMAVSIVHQTEKHNEFAALNEVQKAWLNPSKLLVERALDRWHSTNMRADNTSVVTLMLDPPGPPRAQVLKDRKKNYPATGLKIVTRFKHAEEGTDDCSACSDKNNLEADEHPITKEDITPTIPQTTIEEPAKKPDKSSGDSTAKSEVMSNCSTKVDAIITSSEVSSNSYPLKERNFVPKPRESTSFDPREPYNKAQNEKENQLDKSMDLADNSIQINEISSSSTDLFEHAEEESENDLSKSTKHNLRSSGKIKTATQDKTEPKSHVFKRKNADTEEEPLRKSVRLDKSKRKSDGVSSKENKSRQTTQKLSLAQKILKSKKINLKKKIKKPTMKKKLKLILNSVKQSSTVSSLVRVAPKPALQRKNTNLVESAHMRLERDTCKSSKNEMRSRGRQSGEIIKKSISLLTKNTDHIRSRSEDVGVVNKRAGLRTSADQSHRFRSSSSGEFKVAKMRTSELMGKAITPTKKENLARKSRSLEQIEKINSQDSHKKASLKLLPNGKKSTSPQRKSLRHTPQNQTSSMLQKRLSRSK